MISGILVNYTAVMFPLNLIIAFTAVYVPYYFFKKRKASLVADQYSQLAEVLLSRGATPLGKAHVQESVSPSILSVHKSGGDLDIYNYNGSLVVIHKMNWLSIPHLSITCISKSVRDLSCNDVHHVSPLSVSFRKSALGINTIQIKGIDLEDENRKVNVSLFKMTDDLYEVLKAMEIWRGDIEAKKSTSDD
jgi:hypothetical protein